MAVEFAREGRIGYVTLNRPPANSYHAAFVEELDRAIQAAEQDPQVQAVVVRSALDRFFSAGADVRAFSENPPERNMELVRHAHRVLGRIAHIPKVFVAQIAGHALGGGLEIALACDLRFGAEGEYRLGLPEVTLGLLPGNGGTQRLPRLVGWSRALELMVTGRTLSPQEAYAYGILDRLVPADQLAEQTAEFARRLSEGPVRAVGAIKLAVRLGLDRPLEDGLRLERELVDGLFRSQDAQEGIRAFLEKRAPQFRGA